MALTTSPSRKSRQKSTPVPQHPLPREVLTVLREHLQIQGTTLKITKQLDRECYETVNEVLERCGGTYKTNKRSHAFPYDPTPLIQAVVESGLMPLKNPLEFFHSTPPVLQRIKEILNWSATEGNMAHLLYRQQEYSRPLRILEPSAGVGHIAELLREVFPTAILHCCEFDPFRRSILQSKGFVVVDEPDFLAYQADPYDLVVMNSPFSIGNERDTYIRHIRHAFSLLVDAEESELLAIAPAGFTFTDQQPFYDFYTFVLEHGSLEDLPQDAFKEAGTIIRTMLLWLGKKPLPSFRDREVPVAGYANGRVALAWEWIYDDSDSAKKLEEIFDRMASGELVTYRDGTPALETKKVLKGYCQDIARTARRGQVHIPLADPDYDHLNALIMRRFEEEYPYYVENAVARKQRERQWQIQEAESAIHRKEEALARDKAKIIELAQANRRRKQEIAALTAAYQALQLRLREEPEWRPPERAVPPLEDMPLFAELGPLPVTSVKQGRAKLPKKEAGDDLSQLAFPL